MEQALHQRILELNKCRSDYDDLFEKFKQSNLLFDEKEKLYKNRIKDLQSIVDDSNDKNAQLQKALLAHKSSKKSIQKDVKMLEEATKLLELREQDMSSMLSSTQRSHAALLHELQDLTERNRGLLEERDATSRMVRDEMVPKHDHELLQQRLAKLSASLEHETVSKIQYEQVLEENKILKKRLLHDVVDAKEYEALNHKLQALERRLPFDFVTKDDYYKLQQAHYSLQDDKRVLEESVKLIEDTRDADLKQSAETDAKAQFLKSRVETTEHELSSLRSHHGQLLDEVQTLRDELARTELARRDAEQRLQHVEGAKGQLHAQLSQARLVTRHEQESKQTLADEKAQLEKEAERLRLDYSQRLIESNQKMQEVFGQTEDQLRRRIAALDEELTAQHGTVQELHAQTLRLRDELHAKDVAVFDSRAQVQVAQAHLEAASREAADLRETIVLLKQEKFDQSRQIQLLHKELDDLKALIFTELQARQPVHTPSPSHPLQAHGHGRQTQGQVSPVVARPPTPTSTAPRRLSPQRSPLSPPPPPQAQGQGQGVVTTGSFVLRPHAGRVGDELLAMPTPAPPLRAPSPHLASPAYLDTLVRDFSILHDSSATANRGSSGGDPSPRPAARAPSPARLSYQLPTQSSARKASPARGESAPAQGAPARMSSASPRRRLVPSSSFEASPALPTHATAPSSSSLVAVQRVGGAPSASPSLQLSRANRSPHSARRHTLRANSPDDSLALEDNDIVQAYANNLDRLATPDGH